jgi:L-rhamnose isomerase/sugar isomerase
VFRQPGAARTIWEKVDDCAEIQRVLGVCPVMASHVNWDKTDDGRYEPVRAYAASKGLRIGTVHPNTFLGQEYKFGSVCNPFAEVRQQTIDHFVDCVLDKRKPFVPPRESLKVQQILDAIYASAEKNREIRL